MSADEDKSLDKGVTEERKELLRVMFTIDDEELVWEEEVGASSDWLELFVDNRLPRNDWYDPFLDGNGGSGHVCPKEVFLDGGSQVQVCPETLLLSPWPPCTLRPLPPTQTQAIRQTGRSSARDGEKRKEKKRPQKQEHRCMMENN